MSRISNYFHQVIAAEISSISRFYPKCWLLPFPEKSSILLKKIVCPEKKVLNDFSLIQDGDLLLLDGNLNFQEDIQAFLEKLNPYLKRHNRIAIVLYNPYFKFLYQLGNLLRIRAGKQPTVFLTKLNLANIYKLSGYELVKLRSSVYFPFYIPLFSSFINCFLPLIPGFGSFSISQIALLRPIKISQIPPSLSIIIPARNEKDNLRNAIARIPQFETNDVEIIFVEGNSTDDTWGEIQKIINEYQGPLKLSCYKQKSKGKKDAVDVGFQAAKGEVLTILDADLTMPPENLVQFYQAYIRGLGDFINGNRLCYPMENEAMRPLNLLGNIFFAKALSYVLSMGLSDSLCGTKLFSRTHYQMMQRWNKNFGEFDPFGDFEMIFPACTLGLGTLDIPIKYRNRTYGTTNISRFRDGARLLKMVIIGLFKIKAGKIS